MRYWPLAVVGPFFVLIGVLLIIFRRQFSDLAKGPVAHSGEIVQCPEPVVRLPVLRLLVVVYLSLRVSP